MTATIHPPPRKEYLPESIKGYRCCHLAKLNLTKQPPRTKKPLMKADTISPSPMNPRQETSQKRTENETASSGTTPPYSKNVSTNIGHKFLNLIDKHFPKDNNLRKVFNKNNIKLSYSCMNNIRQIISNHNKTIANEPSTPSQNDSKTNKACNCRKKPDCPLFGGCLQTSVVYQSKILPETRGTEDRRKDRLLTGVRAATATRR
nr:uncharacterized protein LOC133622025 [Nerophis lumbriciformis]